MCYCWCQISHPPVVVLQAVAVAPRETGWCDDSRSNADSPAETRAAASPEPPALEVAPACPQGWEVVLPTLEYWDQPQPWEAHWLQRVEEETGLDPDLWPAVEVLHLLGQPPRLLEACQSSWHLLQEEKNVIEYIKEYNGQHSKNKLFTEQMASISRMKNYALSQVVGMNGNR